MSELKLETDLVIHRELKKIDPIAAREQELFQRGQFKEFQPQTQQARTSQFASSPSADHHTDSLNQLVVQQTTPGQKKKRIKSLKDFLSASKLKLKDARAIEDLGDDEIERLENVVSGLTQDESFKLGKISAKQERILEQSSLFDETSVPEFKANIKARFDDEQRKQGSDLRTHILGINSQHSKVDPVAGLRSDLFRRADSVSGTAFARESIDRDSGDKEMGNQRTLDNISHNIVPEKKGFWGGVASFFKGTAKVAADIGTLVVETDWKKVGCKILEYGGKALADPKTYILAGTAIVKGAAYLAEGTLKAILDPVGTVVRAYGVLKSISDSVGLSDALKGAYSLAKAPLQYAYDLARTGGDFSVANKNYVDNLKDAAAGVVGAFKCFTEVTGLADLYYAAKYGIQAVSLYGEGRKLEAVFALAQCGMHTAFAVASAGSIAGTIATGGAAVGTIAAVAGARVLAKEAVKQTLKVVAKEGLEAIGKSIAKQAIGELGEKVIAETASKMVAEVVSETTQKLTAEVVEQGAERLVAGNVKKVASEVAETHSVKFFTDSGLAKSVEKKGFELFESFNNPKNREKIVALLKDTGKFTAESAEHAYKEIRDALAKGKNDQEIIEALTEGASKPVSDLLKSQTSEVFENGLKKSIQTSRELSEALAENARKAGKSTDDLLEELGRAGKEGYEEGVEKGIKKACRLAFKKSMHRFRERGNLGFGAGGAGGEDEDLAGFEHRHHEFDEIGTSSRASELQNEESQRKVINFTELVKDRYGNNVYEVGYYLTGPNGKTARVVRETKPLSQEN